MDATGPFELIEGKVVPQPPAYHPHGRIAARLNHALNDFVQQRHLGEVYVGGIGIWIRRNPDTARAADLAFIAAPRLKDLSPEGYLDLAPDLVVEITPALARGASVSPDDRWSEVKKKRRDYFSIHVKLIWVIDPDNRTMSVYRSLTDVRELTETDTLTAEDLLPGFTLPVQQLFE